MPIKVTLAKERAQHITKPLSARVSALSFPGAPCPPELDTHVSPSPPAARSTSSPMLDNPLDTLSYLDDDLDSGDDDAHSGHGPPKPPPPDSDEEGRIDGVDGDDDDDGHGPPPVSDDESMGGGCGTPSERDELDSQAEDLDLSPIRKRAVTIHPDSDDEDDLGLNVDSQSVPSASFAKPKTKKPMGWRAGWRGEQRARRDRVKSMNAELAAFQLKQKKKEGRMVQYLAKKYNVRVGAVETKLVGARQWKTKRAASEHKVLTGYYCRKVNEERTANGKLAISFFTAQARVAKKPELIQFSPEVKAKIMEEYAARQKVKITGKRGTALGAAKDVTVTTKRLAEDFSNLRKRTNTVSFSIVAPVDPNNSLSVPTVLDAGGARYMFERHGMTETEVVSDYGKWASMSTKGILNMSLKELQNYCRIFVTRGLAKAAQKPMRMNYDNYCSKILNTHGVHLVGWPNDCPWSSPAEIKKPVPLRSLARAIEKHECYWKVVESDDKLAEIEKEYADLVSKKLQPEPTEHKRRSDKGSVRGKRMRREKQVVEDESDSGEVDAADSVAKNRGRRSATMSSQKTKPPTTKTTSQRKRTHDDANDSDGHQTDGSNDDSPPKKKRSKKSSSDNDGKRKGKKAKGMDDRASRLPGMPAATSEAYRRLRKQPRPQQRQDQRPPGPHLSHGQRLLLETGTH
ncbi:hypothetical protein C8F01DRAFT_1258381 [Mycena amicta]|nr:hypothetical protein C8F01DRAFT_1258381 [Mycena amicta]